MKKREKEIGDWRLEIRKFYFLHWTWFVACWSRGITSHGDWFNWQTCVWRTSGTDSIAENNSGDNLAFFRILMAEKQRSRFEIESAFKIHKTQKRPEDYINTQSREGEASASASASARLFGCSVWKFSQWFSLIFSGEKKLEGSSLFLFLSLVFLQISHRTR